MFRIKFILKSGNQNFTFDSVNDLENFLYNIAGKKIKDSGIIVLFDRDLKIVTGSIKVSSYIQYNEENRK